MIWVELVCDGCCDHPFGEQYISNSVSRLKCRAKEAGWKIINKKIYCPECQKRMKKWDKEESKCKTESEGREWQEET